MPTPEKIALVHADVAGTFMVAPSAAVVWIVEKGWQLQNPDDSQYLVTPPAPAAVDVITRDELDDFVGDLAATFAPFDTGIRSVPVVVEGDTYGSLLAQRVNDEIDFTITADLTGVSSVTALFPVGFRPAPDVVRFFSYVETNSNATVRMALGEDGTIYIDGGESADLGGMKLSGSFLSTGTARPSQPYAGMPFP